RVSTTAGSNGSTPQQSVSTYDEDGNVKMVTVNGHVQIQDQTYDSQNRLIKTTYPDGSFTTTEYDNDGRKTASVDQGLKRTEYSYDAQGRLTEVRAPGGIIKTDYEYDLVGNEITQIDAKGNVTRYTYDKMNRRKTRTLPGGQQEIYESYDETGNLTHKTTFNGQGVGYTYHSLTDRLVSESFAEGGISFTYDGFLRRHSMNDVSGTTSYNYDERNRLIRKTAPQGVLDYTYDPHGNLASTTSGNTNGAAVTYQYDALNRLSKVIDQHRSQALTTTYGYDPIGNLNSVTKPNGEAVTYQYDTLNRLTDMTAKVGTNTIANYHYTLGAAGNRTNVSELNGRNVQYTYDDLYRLTGEIISNDPVVANIGAINYTYDNVGNRQVRTSGIAAVPSQNFSNQYDLNDRLTASGYVYDANGSTTTDPNGTYVYDTLGRMTQAITGSTTTNYVYDGDGNKTSQIVNNGSGPVTTKYLVDTQNPTGYAQVLEEQDGSNAVNKVFTYGTSHISQDQLTNSSWAMSFFGLDGQGSVRYLTDGSGTITDTYDYDAFGTLINQTHVSTATPNEFFYDGEQQDGNTGFYNLRARWMNPGIGRFQTMDSFEGAQDDPSSLHKYIFGSDNPEDKIDPLGTDDMFSVSASEPKLFWSVRIASRLELLPPNLVDDQVVGMLMGEAHGGSAGGCDDHYEKLAMAVYLSNRIYNNVVYLSKHPNAHRPTDMMGVIKGPSSSYSGRNWHKIMISDTVPHKQSEIDNALKGSDRDHFNDCVYAVQDFSRFFGTYGAGWGNLSLPGGYLAPIGYNHSTTIPPNASPASKGTYISAGMIDGTGFWAFSDNQPGKP
ncbi:MAG TPA: RHS repeat-associated core domain-containing protein, partial [Puia sp.]|nr:RHS repeat-associated core domain-containing protein [Puia sp.]